MKTKFRRVITKLLQKFLILFSEMSLKPSSSAFFLTGGLLNSHGGFSTLSTYPSTQTLSSYIPTHVVCTHTHTHTNSIPSSAAK